MDTFIQDLYRLAEDCEYGSLKHSPIRDQNVIGVVDDSLSDQLQAKADLTLEMAVQMSHQAEARSKTSLSFEEALPVPLKRLPTLHVWI